MRCQVLGPDTNVKYGLHLMDWALNTVKKWSVTPVIFIPLLY